LEKENEVSVEHKGIEIDEKRVYQLCVLDKSTVIVQTTLKGKLLKQALLEILRIKVMSCD